MIAEAGIHEGAHLLLEHIALDVAALDRDRGRYLVAVLVVLVQHEIAGSTVPAAADRSLDLQTRVGAEEEGIAGGVHVHSPGGAVVDHDVALAADHGNGEIVVHGEAVRFLVLCRILAEVRELLGGYGERLGIADGVEGEVESVAADVADAADRSLVFFDEGAARDALDAGRPPTTT